MTESKTLLANQVKELDEQTKKQQAHDAKMTVSFWVFCALTVIFGIGSIVFIVLGLINTSNQSHVVDVVLYEHQSPAGEVTASRMSRHIMQSYYVHKHMKWINKIYVLSASKEGYDNILDVTFVPFKGLVEDAFLYMCKIPNVSEFAMFLSDMTFPFREVRKSYMYTMSNHRIFNVFRDEREVAFFKNYLELPTLPVMVVHMSTLAKSENWMDLVFRESTEEKITLFNEMNRDVMIYGNSVNNAQNQFSLLKRHPPLFATFHANPNQSQKEHLQSQHLIANFLHDNTK